MIVNYSDGFRWCRRFPRLAKPSVIEMIRMIMNYDDAYGNDGDGVDGNESNDD